MFAPLFIAQVSASRELLNARPQATGGFDTTDTLIILGFLLVLIVALFSWAYFLRKRPKAARGSHVLVRPRRRRHREHHGPRPAPPSQEGDTPAPARVRRRRRRRSDQDFPRNPTLGETGGLPPVRPEDAPEEPPGPSSPTSGQPRS